MGKSDKPRTIHLRDDEVRGILDGTITQLRRPVKGAHIDYARGDTRKRNPLFRMHLCPFGPPDTVLIGKEVWCPLDLDYRVVTLGFELRDGRGLHIAYKADHIDPNGDGPGNPMPWRSPATMPAWAARIRLVNRGVRVERGDGGWEWVVDVDVEVQP
jgi:hypothetical protein